MWWQLVGCSGGGGGGSTGVMMVLVLQRFGDGSGIGNVDRHVEVVAGG